MPACSLSVTDVEDITRKTGHFQPFDAFVRMITGAVDDVSTDAFLDLSLIHI